MRASQKFLAFGHYGQVDVGSPFRLLLSNLSDLSGTLGISWYSVLQELELSLGVLLELRGNVFNPRLRLVRHHDTVPRGQAKPFAPRPEGILVWGHVQHMEPSCSGLMTVSFTTLCQLF